MCRRSRRSFPPFQPGKIDAGVTDIETLSFPSVGVSARRMQRAVVVLPHPLSPTSASVSPFWIVKLDTVHRAHLPDHASQ